VDADQVTTLRVLLARTGWLERARDFGRALRTTPRSPGGLLLVGTPDFEPWHLTAHLDEESRLAGLPLLAPTLVRWSPPPDAPPHLRVGLDRLEAAQRGETLFVVTEDTAPVPLLERVNDARRVGATILALDGGFDPELEGLAHESLAAPAVVSFDATQHLVSAAAGDRYPETGDHGDGRGVLRGRSGRGRQDTRSPQGLRDRVARLLDIVSGPSA
jgi:hypothetical protein